MGARISWTESTATSEGETTSLNVNSYTLEFDADMRRVVTSRADVTEFAVETGAALSDHKKTKPRIIQMVGRVTNTPIGNPPPSGQSSQRRITTAVRGTGAGNTLVFSEEFDRVQDVYDALKDLVSKPIFVTLETPQEVFERVTVSSVEDIRSAPHYDGAEFNITFQEIFLAETEEVEIPIPAEPRGQNERDESANSAQDSDADEDSAPQSWTLGLGRSVGIFD